jgi:DNA-binding HxlR family transcriptional regulator
MRKISGWEVNGLLRGTVGAKEIPPRVLSREMKALAESGLIGRQDCGLVPPNIDYLLTPAGAVDLFPRQPVAWGWTHGPLAA